MEKLVRDLIPDIIRAKGEECVVRVAASDQEYADFLNVKLGEEIGEFYSAADAGHRVEEMADVMEVIRAVMKFYGIDANEVERIREDKLKKRGGFEKRIIWKDTVGYYENKAGKAK
ncbi:MAG: nucleoside triphosphate pyrophosphohydrolase [Rickettsiales bacterium]|jgi:predicted house-cleaning noncanonical NTP pyrophosphatase (MazG superfamily)|nr:nucleoside triphosphate pyrophosphohydrolase [Rickettsiales bacterium]